MDKIILCILSAILSGVIGFAIGGNNTISKEDHNRIINNYKEDVQHYKDYVEAIDKISNASSIENDALQILRSKLPTE